jgi:hypothetical protein
VETVRSHAGALDDRFKRNPHHRAGDLLMNRVASGPAISITKWRKIVYYVMRSTTTISRSRQKYWRNSVDQGLPVTGGAMGYRILNQNSSPTPSAISPVKRPGLKSPESWFPSRGETSGLDLFGSWDGFRALDGGGESGTQFPEESTWPKHCAPATKGAL